MYLCALRQPFHHQLARSIAVIHDEGFDIMFLQFYCHVLEGFLRRRVCEFIL